MQFLNPGMLWGLLVLAVPIIIHLFYFRKYKKVTFTNVEFLAELKEEKSVRDQLRRLLILLMRLLAIIAIVIAFARPYILGVDAGEKKIKVVSIYLDNSFSMHAFSQEADLLEEGKRIAREIMSSYPDGIEFQVLSNDFGAQYQRLQSKVDALQLIDELETSSLVATISEIQEIQERTLAPYAKDHKAVYYISDFQERIIDSPIEMDSTFQVYVVPLQSEQKYNIAIDSVWLESPTIQPKVINTLYVKSTNYGSQDAHDVRIAIEFQNTAKPLGSTHIPAGTSVVDTVTMLPNDEGWQGAKITISDFPIEFDNHYFIAFDVPDKLRVLSIYDKLTKTRIGTNVSEMRLLDFDSQDISQIDYSSLGQYDLIILNDIQSFSSGAMKELEHYVFSGGKLCIFPAHGADISNYNLLLSNMKVHQISDRISERLEVYKLDENAFVFKNVYERTNKRISLPVSTEYYTFQERSRQPSQELLVYRNGRPYMQQFKSGDGFVYVSSAPLSIEYNNLVQRGDVFAPMIYRMALQKGANSRLSYTIGGENIIQIPRLKGTTSDVPLKMKGAVEFIPSQQTVGASYILDVSRHLSNAGIYDVLHQDSIIRKIAMNYNRKESDLSLTDISILKANNVTIHVIEGADQRNVEVYLKQSTLGTELWWYCILFALFFLALEQIIIRFVSND